MRISGDYACQLLDVFVWDEILTTFGAVLMNLILMNFIGTPRRAH